MISSSRLRIVLVLCIALLGAVSGAPVSAQRTPGLDEARARADRLAQDIADAETELSGLEAAAESARSQETALSDEAASLVDQVADAAIADFTRSGSGPNLLESDDLMAGMRADTLGDAALGADADTLERYRGLFEDLAVVRFQLAEAVASAETTFADLLVTREELGAELARLEELEKERLEEERLAREAAARQAAAERAAAGGTPVLSGGGGGGGGGGGALSYCPVAGPNSFIDSWGYARSGGRRHKGVDMMANIGVPIVAPVSGTVSHRSNRVGGRSFHLNGDDGNYYYGTHLSDYGQSGWVAAGTVIGYVGDDGNARGIPHLHFEVHPGGGSAVNPYPYVRSVC